MEKTTNETAITELASGLDLLDPRTKTVESVRSNELSFKKSVAIVPRQHIFACTDKDVLSGRGGGTNLHPGNRYYRDLILSHLQNYDNASKPEKPAIAKKIVQLIRDNGGRFLGRNDDGSFYDIGDSAAKEKTSQALRHRTFEMRNRRLKDKRSPAAKSLMLRTQITPLAPTSKSKQIHSSSFRNSIRTSLNHKMESQLCGTASISNPLSYRTSKASDSLQMIRGTTSNDGIPFLFALRRQAILELDGALQEARIKNIYSILQSLRQSHSGLGH